MLLELRCADDHSAPSYKYNWNPEYNVLYTWCVLTLYTYSILTIVTETPGTTILHLWANLIPKTKLWYRDRINTTLLACLKASVLTKRGIGKDVQYAYAFK